MRPRPFGPGYLHGILTGILNLTYASMRPRPFGPGYPRGSEVITLTTPASMRPRPFGPGYPSPGSVPEPESMASMRPRPFGPGYPSLSRNWLHITASFNEAQAFRPRIPGRPGGRILRFRGFNEAQDTPQVPEISGNHQDASMRPRPFGPGYMVRQG